MVVVTPPSSSSSSSPPLSSSSFVLPLPLPLSTCSLTTLETLLAQQHHDLHTLGTYACMVCPSKLETRHQVFMHLIQDHDVQLGRPEHIVYVTQFLDYLTSQVNQLICIYCQHVFKDRRTLLHHLRKKKHLRIPALDARYDGFYWSPYSTSTTSSLDLERNEDVTEERGVSDLDEEEEDEEERWSDWMEDEDEGSGEGHAGTPTYCFVCNFRSTSLEENVKHVFFDTHHETDLTIQSFHAWLQTVSDMEAIQFINHARWKRCPLNHVFPCQVHASLSSSTSTASLQDEDKEEKKKEEKQEGSVVSKEEAGGSHARCFAFVFSTYLPTTTTTTTSMWPRPWLDPQCCLPIIDNDPWLQYVLRYTRQDEEEETISS
ncbi:hypothetical protein HMI54_014546 [Coelomomyces lativittatus]|nr:hypothetical protein HMI55_006659 [Coelomomyces lativittatus]KAJ1512931.1 hypothetical protein HMI56_003315 [Coelomomyces lativittatus]KAJ1518591.1 hypothetical protein HMI54_014546 [Coelomomyces lativittatus]